MMRLVVVALLCMVAGLVVMYVWEAGTTMAAVREALYVAGFVIRLLFLIVLMLADAGLLGVLGATMLG